MEGIVTSRCNFGGKEIAFPIFADTSFVEVLTHICSNFNALEVGAFTLSYTSPGNPMLPLESDLDVRVLHLSLSNNKHNVIDIVINAPHITAQAPTGSVLLQQIDNMWIDEPRDMWIDEPRELAKTIKIREMKDYSWHLENVSLDNMRIDKLRELAKTIKIREMKDYSWHLENISLYFGCKIGQAKFSSLWKSEKSVAMDFRSEIVQFGSSEYRLNLSSRSILKVELHLGSPKDTVRRLVIQLSGAPRIYVNSLQSEETSSRKKWTRTTDFTKDFCIGQSSAICLELPPDSQIPEHIFQKCVEEASIWESDFILENGIPLSDNHNLVPIIMSDLAVELPYDVFFKLNSLVQHGRLSWPTIDNNFYNLLDAPPHPRFREYTLEDLSFSKEVCCAPSQWLSEQFDMHAASNIERPLKASGYGLIYIPRVKISPSRVYFCGPELNVSNRVLRNYQNELDNFIRVSFVDEEGDKIYLSNVSSQGIYERIVEVMKNGITIGKKKFEFLAFSTSQLRDSSLWMFASTPCLTAAGIRNWMGEFKDIRNVAKYSARLGLSFSSSVQIMRVDSGDVEMIPDIENDSQYCFSDGVGKISQEFANEVSSVCGCAETPSVFQIRYRGYKGVVAVDPASSKKLSLRKSMLKYKSENTMLDVLDWSMFHPLYLNRQLITLLSTLQVQDQVFIEKQRKFVDQLNDIFADSSRAREALHLMARGETTDIVKKLLSCGYGPHSDPFISMMLQTFQQSKMLELRCKTKIFISEGRVMTGCMDESATLEYGQVFVQYSNRDGESVPHSIVHGRVFVAKNPCLHPGDVRILTAVDVEPLHHMVDCIVFPQKGLRPHPNEISGSDLDGDMYAVCWDQDLIPEENYPPMDYSSPQTVQLDHEVTMEEIQRYFADYTVTDTYGLISNAHIVFADKNPGKAKSEECLQLAKLGSDAVDYAKTGIPAELPPHLRPKLYPDFMEKSDKPTYESSTVLGLLYRNVKDVAPSDVYPIKPFDHKWAEEFDKDLIIPGCHVYLKEAVFNKWKYDEKLASLMDFYGIKMEAEIMGAGFMKMSKTSTKGRDVDTIDIAVRGLREEARSWFNKHEPRLDSMSDEVYKKASAWYYACYFPSFFGEFNVAQHRREDREHYISFCWCVYDKLMELKREQKRKQAAGKRKRDDTSASGSSAFEHLAG